MNGGATPFPYRCEGRIPLFETQHEAVRFMQDYLVSGHMKPCINLNLGFADSWARGRRYGPACDRDSFSAKPVEESARSDLYSFFGCPSDCCLYQPRSPEAEPKVNKPSSPPAASSRISRAVKVASITAGGTVAAALVAGLLTGWFSAKDKPSQPVVPNIVQSPTQQQAVQRSSGSTNIQAGRDVVIQQIPKGEVIPVRPGVADELARLYHRGQKRYYDWWESCFDPQGRPQRSDPARRAEAEKIRLVIMDKLERELGSAEAVLFNTPRMNEPFPVNQTLALCPDGIEIKQFGYQLNRLAEIIERARRTPSNVDTREPKVK